MDRLKTASPALTLALAHQNDGVDIYNNVVERHCVDEDVAKPADAANEWIKEKIQVMQILRFRFCILE